VVDDADKVPPGTTLHADVCIVGAGAAGITLARELADTKHSVVLLESGRFEFEDATQDLYIGSSSGMSYDTRKSRLRLFGGSTNHWAGQCRPLDASDFEARSWVPGSGWPFGRGELRPYYEKAQGMCDLGPFEYDASWWVDRMDGVRPIVDNDTIRTAIFQLGPGTLFGDKFRDDVTKAKNTKVVLGANVVNVRLDGTRVAGVDCKTLAGNSFAVDAKVVVVATGGIENARLLLASRTQRPNGVGNDADLVGRYFMDHALVIGGTMVLSDRAPDPAIHFWTGLPFSRAGLPNEENIFRGRRVLGMLALSAKAAEANQLPSLSVHLFPPANVAQGAIGTNDLTGFVGAVEGRTARTRKTREITVLPGDVRRTVDRFDFRVGMEPTPSPDSRVTLTGELDPLGMPRLDLRWARLDLRWAFSPVDFGLIERGVAVMGRELGRLGLGRVRRYDAETSYLEYGNHHMGTTRMHRDPAQGVVDQHSQVHGIDGLYVAGSSVFPTAGFANPTLTIVALALRLGKRLKKVLR
jgi:choline dehydrogenase-like flavoprotein